MDLSISTETIDALFSSTYANTQGNLDALAGTVLGRGIDYFQEGKYELAVRAFKQSAALSPFSENTAKAYDYISKAFIKLDRVEEAIKNYQEAIRIYPSDDTFHVALGDLYLEEKMLEEAVESYEAAVRINPNDAESRYSLGQSCLESGETDRAREQFNQVVRISPANAAGYYGLGEVARASGDLNGAIAQLNKAIRMNQNFELAYVELGYAYADMGDFKSAESQLAVLKNKGSDRASELEEYLEKAARPAIASANSKDGFDASLGPKTPVSDLSSGLADANASKLFSMTFSFSKDMDASSVVNARNWTISRATVRNNGGVYNYGMPPTSSEAFISPNPAYVLFDAETNMATVYFRISQNQNANATIDPNHIVFRFSGVDAYGKAMDPSADEYSGFSRIA